MPQLKERPSALLDAAPRSRRESRYALLEDLDYRDRRRSTGVGIVLTIIVWLACFFLFNLLITRISEQHAAATASAATRSKPKFDIQLQDDSFLMPAKPTPPPPQFVETNPDAPENIPDKTNNFAAQNQQAAQEKPDPTGKSDRAATEGKKDWESNQIVSGQLNQPPVQPQPPPPPPTPEIQESKAVTQPTPAQREQVPLTGDQKLQGDSATGYGMNDIKPPDFTTAKPDPSIDQLVKGMPDAQTDAGLPRINIPRIDPRHPQPRPKVAKNVRPAILADNQVGTKNIGPSGIDAKWSNYGQYLQKLIDTVQIQFDDLNEKSKVYPPTGTKVTVKFRLDSEGKIAEIVDADGNGGTQAKSICVSAITDRSPYGKWTDDMVAMLGDSQEMTFTFYYGTP